MTCRNPALEIETKTDLEVCVVAGRCFHCVSSHFAGGRRLQPSGSGTDIAGWCSSWVRSGFAPNRPGGSAPQTQTPDTSADDASTLPGGSPGSRDAIAFKGRKKRAEKWNNCGECFIKAFKSSTNFALLMCTLRMWLRVVLGCVCPVIDRLPLCFTSLRFQTGRLTGRCRTLSSLISLRAIFFTVLSSSESMNFLMATRRPESRWRHFSTVP